MKKNKFITVYSIIVSVIFVVTIAMFGAYLYKEYSTGYVRTRKTFDAMNTSVKNTLQASNGSSVGLMQKIESSIDSLDDYFYLDVKQNGKSIYTYAPKGTVPTENTNMIKLYFNTTKVGDDTLYINAAMYTLRPTTIAGYAKIAFTVILIFTIITILLIIYVNVTLNNSDVISYEEDNETENNVDESAPETIENSSEETEQTEQTEISDSETQTEPVEEEQVEKEPIAEEKVYEEKPAFTEKDETEESPQNAELPVNDVKPANIETTDQGLFSPDTGFGWESYLQTRLENEIERATSLEFDLILMLIKVKNISRKSELIQEISPVLVNEFQFKDLIFEYKDDSFAAIKTNCSIDDAIPLADKLHTEISKIISEAGGKCYIGLTSRTIRLVSGERLLKEAEAALEHAQEDEDSPIIAFRANTEKYLEFIDRQ